MLGTSHLNKIFSQSHIKWWNPIRANCVWSTFKGSFESCVIPLLAEEGKAYKGDEANEIILSYTH